MNTSPVEAPPLPAQVLSLFEDFCRHLSIPEADLTDAVGLEFVSGDFVVAICPLGAGGASLAVDVQIMGLAFEDPETDVQRLLFLHRLNELSRMADGWMATIDLDDMLVISRTFRTADLDAATLAREIADGLSRAADFAEAWSSLTHDLWTPAMEPTSEEEDTRAGEAPEALLRA